jgi:hypothetical protein
VTSFRRARIVLPTLAVIVLAAWAMLTVFAAPASAIKVEDRGTGGLDGNVVMSPAAERVETTLPDGGGDPIGPGAVVKRAVIIHNRTKAPVTFDLDVSEVVGSSAELIVEIKHGSHGGAAAWVTLSDSTFTLKPGQQGTIGVTIKIPANVKPGSKPFAVTATQRAPQVQTTGAGIAPQFKQSGIFIMELPGDAPVKGSFTKATITSAQKSIAAAKDGGRAPVNARWYVSPHWADTHDLTLATEYRNTGERLLTPSGKSTVKDIFGRVAGRYDIDQFTVYPGGSAAKTTELKGLPSLGIFTASVKVQSEAGGTQSTTLPRFVMVPKWFLLAVAAFVLFGLFRLARWQLRRRREWKRFLAEGGDEGTAVVADGEDYEGDELEDAAWDVDEDEDAERV